MRILIAGAGIADIGASMAMDSTAALDGELSRTDIEHLGFALRLYKNRQKSVSAWRRTIRAHSTA